MCPFCMDRALFNSSKGIKATFNGAYKYFFIEIFFWLQAFVLLRIITVIIDEQQQLIV